MAIDWAAWYLDILDGLVAAVENAGVTWATDAEDEPWVVQGQRRPGGISYPHAMILEFGKRRDDAESKRRHELCRIGATIAVFREGDPLNMEENLRQSLQDMAAVETALYDDRTLGGSCDLVVIDESSAFELENANDTTETVGTISLTITKDADIR